MAAYSHALSWTDSLIRPKWGSGGSEAIAFGVPEVARVRVTSRSTARGGTPYALETPVPAWIEPTIRALTNLLQLPENWDGYGAVQIREQIAQQALITLAEIMENETPTPSIVPLSDGGVQIEWHRYGRNLEIEFPAGEAPGYYYYEDDSDVESEGQVSRDCETIQSYISNLK